MAGRGILDPLMMVRIHPSQPSGVIEQRLVRGALNPQTRVQLPVTLPFLFKGECLAIILWAENTVF